MKVLKFIKITLNPHKQDKKAALIAKKGAKRPGKDAAK